MHKFILVVTLLYCVLYLQPTLTQAQTDTPVTNQIEIIDGSGVAKVVETSYELPVTGANQQTTCTAAAPTLLTPAEGSISNDLLLPRYTWRVVSGIREYILQIAEEETFASPLDSERGFALAGDTEATASSFEPLIPNQTYFWRVASVCTNGQIGAFSKPVSFQTGETSGTIPCTRNPPQLLEPDDGEIVDTLIPNLRWSTEENVYEYDYQVSDSPTFEHFIKNGGLYNVRPDIRDTTGTNFNDNLKIGTTYYWRVASSCAELDTTGEYSEPFSFQTTNDTSNLPAIVPTLVIPVDGVTTGSIRVPIQFEKTSDATGYRVEFARTRGRAEQGNGFYSIETTADSVVAVFNPEETLYWWVGTRNAYGWGARSGVRSFTTPTDRATTTIIPDTGGTVRPDPGYLTVTFPRGAVEASTEVSFRLFAKPLQALPYFSFANRAFSLEATANGEPVTQFAQPYTMVVGYDKGDLLAAGIDDPNELNLVFWNGSAWEEILPCTGCAIDTTAQTITVVLDHFTDFALVGPLPPHMLYLPLVQR
ncbi:MAG: hypothetical protein KDE58_29465 [Caldilineaceae bacterium]|nr:hypothetical protein [Caldilineaceae bacterium]